MSVFASFSRGAQWSAERRTKQAFNRPINNKLPYQYVESFTPVRTNNCIQIEVINCGNDDKLMNKQDKNPIVPPVASIIIALANATIHIFGSQSLQEIKLELVNFLGGQLNNNLLYIFWSSINIKSERICRRPWGIYTFAGYHRVKY